LVIGLEFIIVIMHFAGFIVTFLNFLK
jgi:hypothetical protein